MCDENLANKYKQRFKGVESFLRRVAFNLGNSPSQTEVKIISCIPIDVTDLQQKIVCLEKELETAKANSHKQQDTVVQTVICHHPAKANFQQRSNETAQTAHIEQCEDGCSKRSGLGSHESNTVVPPVIQGCSHWPSDMSTSNNKEQCEVAQKRGLFKKKKKDNCKMQLVYYAQTDNSPFITHRNSPHKDQSDDIHPMMPPLHGDALSQTYVSEIVQKQYTAVPVTEEFAITSQFSSPVCRDIDHTPEQHWRENNQNDSDLCSCCHGTFHNIDNHTNNSHLPSFSHDTYNKNSEFYDTSLYDMVPVKEKPGKASNPFYETPRKNLFRCEKKVSHIPERGRKKCRYHPFIVNYSKTPTSPYNYSRKPLKKDRFRKISPKRDNVEILKNYYESTSKSCFVDCGNVYTKRGNTEDGKTQSSLEPLVNVTHKNAECLTMNLNNTECQTTTTQSVQIDNEVYDDKKTEETLNQIKVILQTVLTEVKTNAQMKKTPEEKSTKDAIVQKGISNGNMPGCSSLLHSFTYSPYSLNPYLTSCSRHMNSGPCCFTNFPYQSRKCMQSFPVFIQTPGRNVHASCYRNSSHIAKTATKQATTSTNTDSKEHSKETEKLIKEIYKSMAVNLALPTKETLVSDYEDLRSITPHRSVIRSVNYSTKPKEEMKKLRELNKASLRKENFKSSLVNSKLTSNTVSLRSQIVSTTDTEQYLRNSRIESYLKNLEKPMPNKIVQERIYEETTSSTSEEEDDVSISTRQCQQNVIVQKIPVIEPEKNSVKKGLFREMFKRSVKFFSPNKKVEQVQIENEVDVETEDESDDYQTIHSHREQRRGTRYIQNSPQSIRQKTHSKISFPRHRDRNQDLYRKVPYIEQGDRRHLNENLVLRNNQFKYSSEAPRSRDTRRRSIPVYWQNYEARSALVGHGITRNKVSPVVCNSIKKFIPPRTPRRSSGPKVNAAKKGLFWLRKHKLGIHCGPQWKKLVLEG